MICPTPVKPGGTLHSKKSAPRCQSVAPWAAHTGKIHAFQSDRLAGSDCIKYTDRNRPACSSKRASEKPLLPFRSADCKCRSGRIVKDRVIDKRDFHNLTECAIAHARSTNGFQSSGSIPPSEMFMEWSRRRYG